MRSTVTSMVGRELREALATVPSLDDDVEDDIAAAIAWLTDDDPGLDDGSRTRST